MMSFGSLSPNVDTRASASKGRSKPLAGGPRSRCLMRTTVKEDALHETKEENDEVEMRWGWGREERGTRKCYLAGLAKASSRAFLWL